MRKCYLLTKSVQGREGILGCFSSRKKAAAAAREHATRMVGCYDLRDETAFLEIVRDGMVLRVGSRNICKYCVTSYVEDEYCKSNENV